MGASGIAVATTFGVQICLALIVFMLFSYLRLTGFARRFYAPKRFDASVEHKPGRLPTGPISWMIAIHRYPESDLIQVSGLGPAIYLRVLRFGWEVFIKVTLITCIILLPIHLTGNQVDTLMSEQNSGTSSSDQDYQFTAFDKCSIANIKPGSNRLWAHVVLVYVITYLVLTTLNRYNGEATLLRLAFMATAPRGGPSHTVLVTDIPGMRYGTVVWYLRGLVGSTLFLLLPAGLKKKILDTVESGITKVGDAARMDIAKAIERDKEREAANGPPPPPVVPNAMAKAAEANTQHAEEEEATKKNAGTGVLEKPHRRPFNELMAADESLNPWHQAEDVLGDMNNPRADRVAYFVRNEMEGTYGRSSVASVNPVWDQDELNPLVKEYAKIKQQLEDYLDDCTARIKRRKPIKKRKKVTVVGPTMGQWGIERYGVKAQKVDALDHWSARLGYLSREIPEAQRRCIGTAIPAAFVTVQHRSTQVTMCTTLHHHDETTWQIQGAPEPKEIIWGNVPMRRWERATRTIAMWAVYLVMLCFYMIPVTAVQGLLNVPRLATVPVLGDIVNAPVLKQLLEGILPGLVLLIFLALLPKLLAIFCRISGFVSISQVDFGVVTRYFYFQVVALFLGSLVAGSLFNQLKQFVKSPTSIVTILGAAIPGTAAFFINYVLVAGIGKTGIRHLRIVQLILFWIRSKVAATARARSRLWSEQTFLYGPAVPDFTIYFLLGIVYCCVNPIIAPTVLLFYSFAIISEKYNQLYVFKTEYDGGGQLWYYVFNQFMVGMYFFQVFMIVLLSIKKFAPAAVLVPAPLISLVFHVSTVRLHRRPWTVLSAHDAAMLDNMDRQSRGIDTITPQEKRLIQDMYMSPAFKIKGEEVDALLREADVVSRQINGEKLHDIEADLDEKEYQSAEEDYFEPPSSSGKSRTMAYKVGGPQQVVTTRTVQQVRANGGMQQQVVREVTTIRPAATAAAAAPAGAQGMSPTPTGALAAQLRQGVPPGLALAPAGPSTAGNVNGVAVMAHQVVVPTSPRQAASHPGSPPGTPAAHMRAQRPIQPHDSPMSLSPTAPAHGAGVAANQQLPPMQGLQVQLLQQPLLPAQHGAPVAGQRLATSPPPSPLATLPPQMSASDPSARGRS